MKLLIIGDKKHVFVYNLVKWIRKTNPTIKQIDVVHRNSRKYQTDFLYDQVFSYECKSASIPVLRRFYKDSAKNKYFKRIIGKLQSAYDVVHIHYVELRLVKNADFLAKNIRGKLIVSIWGSDFYRSNNETRLKMLPILQRADLITFENPEMRDEFRSYYANTHGTELKNLLIVRFGLEPLEKLEILNKTREECKTHLNIPNEKISVCIGYNAFPGQQHLEILDSFQSRREELEDKVHLVLPLTYGGDSKYINLIIKKLNTLGYQYTALTSFLNDREVAMLRKASDYFVNLQITDQLSGSMLEHLYAGSTVLTGSWLPYNVLDEMGIKMIKVDDVSKTADAIAGHFINGKEFDRELNSKAIYQFSYWGNCITKWNQLYAKTI